MNTATNVNETVPMAFLKDMVPNSMPIVTVVHMAVMNTSVVAVVIMDKQPVPNSRPIVPVVPMAVLKTSVAVVIRDKHSVPNSRTIMTVLTMALVRDKDTATTNSIKTVL